MNENHKKEPKTEGRLKFLVAIKNKEINEIFGFKTQKDANEFADDIQQKFPGTLVAFATDENGVDVSNLLN